MGYGNYSLEAHEAIVSSRNAATMTFASVFNPKMNPLGVSARESRDSAEHPDSLSIIFAHDVSTSMGAIPRSLATRTLPSFMAAAMAVLQKGGVSHLGMAFSPVVLDKLLEALTST